MRFPDLDARTLQGTPKRLPEDLPADRTLVLLAFRQWQQRQVDAWIDRAEEAGWAPDLALTQDRVARAVIEVPCLARHWALGRSIIDGGMSRNIGVPEVLARTWTAYTDVGAAQRSLGIPGSDELWVGVVESSGGQVVTTASGDPSPQAWNRVAAAMA